MILIKNKCTETRTKKNTKMCILPSLIFAKNKQKLGNNLFSSY